MTGIIEISSVTFHQSMQKCIEYYIDDLNSFFRERDIATYNKSIELAYDLFKEMKLQALKILQIALLRKIIRI